MLRTLDSIVGNTNIINVLKRELLNDTLGNFSIFEGDPGTGKSTTAEIVGLYLTCEHPNGYNPCLHCSHWENNLKMLKVASRGINFVKYNMASKTVKTNLENILTEVFRNVADYDKTIFIFEEFHA